MATRLNETWHFRQKDFIAKHALGAISADLADGVCASLSCRWAKMMLKARKSVLGSPQLTSDQRESYFNGRDKPIDIAARQDMFDKVRADARRATTQARTDLQLSRQLVQGQAEVSASQIAQGQRIVDKLRADYGNVDKETMSSLLVSNKLHLVETTNVSSLAEYFLNSKSGHCYIFESTATEHTTAGYVTGGILNNDYIFFDPNSGEFTSTGKSDCAATMSRFQEHYRKLNHRDTSALRHRVEYRK